MEPVEITSPKALKKQIEQGGVITVTRGTFEIPVAHMPDCRAVKRKRIPTDQTRYWWTPNYAAALTGLGARKRRQCRWPRQARHQ